jgi:hypothetical protein
MLLFGKNLFLNQFQKKLQQQEKKQENCRVY